MGVGSFPIDLLCLCVDDELTYNKGSPIQGSPGLGGGWPKVDMSGRRQFKNKFKKERNNISEKVLSLRFDWP